MAELSPRADFSSSSVRLYRDVEKIVLVGK